MEQIKSQISVSYYKECCEFMEKVREHRHRSTLERHLRKYEWLCQQNKGGHSNKQQHHTCMAQNTAQTPDAVPSSSPSITPAPTTITAQSKWVKNLLIAPLSEAQVSLLARGPNFAITPRSLPYGEYITVVEQACLNLEPHNAEELRAEIRGALRHAHNPRKTITKEEAQALAELRKDHTRVTLIADKGVALVVMDRADYNNKSHKLLEDRGTYREIKTDPTNKLKKKLVSLLKKIKAEGGISDQLYKKMYPTGAVAPKFYGLPKIHKRDIPLRPIVSSGAPLIMNWPRSY